MSSLTETPFFLQCAPLPANFKGTPQKFLEEILRRARVISPYGIVTFVTGPVEPSSNQGPWLRDGTKWYVWSGSDAKYMPLDISDSVTPPYWVQAEQPPTGIPALWFKIDETGRVVGTFLHVLGEWRVADRFSYGNTENRPSSPFPYQEYFDIDIETHIWWERGAWRTVSGVKGDLKYVDIAKAEDALKRNPGWAHVSKNYRGRVLAAAAKNSGADPTTDLDVGTDITSRSALSVYGEETSPITMAELGKHMHKDTYSSDQYIGIAASAGSTALAVAFAYKNLEGGGGNAINLAGANEAGNGARSIIQPTRAAWLLVKE